MANSWVLLALVIGAVLALVGYLGYRDALTRERAGGEVEELPAGLRVASGRVPWVLWLVYAATVLGMVGYVLFVWLAKPNL